MNTILVIWTVVAMQNGYRERDWRPIGVFATPASCEKAAKELVLDASKYRCVSVGL